MKKSHNSQHSCSFVRIVVALSHQPALMSAVSVAVLWAVVHTSPAWAQAQIDVPPLSEWLDTVAWYSFIPILRILGALIIVAGLASTMSGRPGMSGSGVIAMVIGGVILLVPEIVDAIYTRTDVGTQWATQP